MNAVANSQPYEVPEGGLASFLTATVGDWSDEALNSDTYYDIVKPTAEQLAEFGRVGDDGRKDDRIAHVATGETVIPLAVFEEDPNLKESLFRRMREMGLEPEQYIVGNELNSINPVTGQPEFIFKSIVKGVKKAVKGVVKVFKTIAPIVLSIGLAMTPLGAIAGAALGSGIGTLVQGGSLKDAFKGALIGGALGGLTSGIGSVLKGGEFMAGVKAGLPDALGGGFNPTLPEIKPPEIINKSIPTESVTTEIVPPQTGSAAPAAAAGTPASTAAASGVDPFAPTAVEKARLAEQGLTYVKGPPSSDILLAAGPTPGGNINPVVQSALDANAAAAAKGAAAKNITPLLKENVTAEMLAKLDAPTLSRATINTTGSIPAFPDPVLELAEAGVGTYPGASGYVGASGAITSAGEAAVRATLDQRGFLESMRDFLRTGDLGSLKQAFIPDKLTADNIQQFMESRGHDTFTLSAGQNLADALVAANVSPGLMRSYLPMLGLGTVALGAFGGFAPGPMPEPYDAFAGMDRTPYPFAAPGSQFRAAAGGGEMTSFPRKNGAIRGPGTETSDDIPAMLSDGEFVMTARAVRGAGNGSRQDGMKRMYDMMRTFEGRAARGN